ncbi:MAG: hypothetical protein QOJ99_843 [Bryobacterales bacterium]|nr:hypothetical protein [Bryobacterales bacterium]
METHFIARSARLSFVAGALVCIADNSPVLAYHSFAAEFNDQRPVKLTGKIVNVRSAWRQ